MFYSKQCHTLEGNYLIREKLTFGLKPTYKKLVLKYQKMHCFLQENAFLATKKPKLNRKLLYGKRIYSCSEDYL